MVDLKLDSNGDLELSAAGDVIPTDSIAQAVRIRLLWFFEEWRLGPELSVLRASLREEPERDEAAASDS